MFDVETGALIEKRWYLEVLYSPESSANITHKGNIHFPLVKGYFPTLLNRLLHYLGADAKIAQVPIALNIQT